MYYPTLFASQDNLSIVGEVVLSPFLTVRTEAQRDVMVCALSPSFIAPGSRILICWGPCLLSPPLHEPVSCRTLRFPPEIPNNSDQSCPRESVCF